ncbi:hypothetical protein [Vibrio aestuarianus]|uniref:hypothetical protein n=1 Tax=Vibrio aestuarianus TaxID=28171 RepID=UPI001445822E|nr:hypothetical protein [Vibrio aestuarianus]NKZ48269.1 hypothetical protein [Vibrio aestuarianus subsp. francensis]
MPQLNFWVWFVLSFVWFQNRFNLRMFFFTDLLADIPLWKVWGKTKGFGLGLKRGVFLLFVGNLKRGFFLGSKRLGNFWFLEKHRFLNVNLIPKFLYFQTGGFTF